MENPINKSIITSPPRKVEIIDDIVYMSPAPSIKHNNIMGNIYYLFRNYLKGKKCKVYQVSNVYYNPDKPKNHIIPDIAVMCEPDKFKPNGYYGVPSLIVEILSTNRKDDLKTKFELYERIGVAEYWIVDPTNNTINQYVLVDGDYTLIEAFIYLLDEEIENLSDDEQKEYKAFINPTIFENLEISLEDIFED
ncbi:MAG: hypothetical protein ATN35_09665 [Epulopiscium sp. Nele67-Bin004]|nr:MAG: hypothetical protein ATN35_09665 [Epulopiscium sp. Nele67-Bin004]